MRFRYMTALYNYSPDIDQVGIMDAERALLNMATTLVGTNDLLAIYVPEGTEEVYAPGNKRGRVVGAVRLLAMPAGKTIRDFCQDDWDGTRRWPIGWPCRSVLSPPVEQCPTLRTLVGMAHGPNSFQPYVSQFLNGPFKIDREMADLLMRQFTRICEIAR